MQVFLLFVRYIWVVTLEKTLSWKTLSSLSRWTCAFFAVIKKHPGCGWRQVRKVPPLIRSHILIFADCYAINKCFASEICRGFLKNVESAWFHIEIKPNILTLQYLMLFQESLTFAKTFTFLAFFCRILDLMGGIGITPERRLMRMATGATWGQPTNGCSDGTEVPTAEGRGSSNEGFFQRRIVAGWAADKTRVATAGAAIKDSSGREW